MLMHRYLVPFAASILTVLVSFSQAFATDIPVMGAHGDKGFHTVCQPGSFMVGLQVHSGLWVDQIALKCASVAGDGTVGNPVTLEAHGGPGGGPQPGSDTCGPGAVVSGMHVSFTPNERQVRFFVLDCRSEGDGNIAPLRIGASAQTSPPRDQICPPGELALGVNGNEGKHVNAVGLICGPNPKQGGKTGAEQALEAKCKNYASQAVAQFAEYVAHSCGPDSGHPNRWSNNYVGHYNWCLSVGASSPLPNNEDSARRGLLSQCSTHGGGAISTPPVKFCAADCNTCSQQKLQCSANNQCAFKTPSAPWACY